MHQHLLTCFCGAPGETSEQTAARVTELERAAGGELGAVTGYACKRCDGVVYGQRCVDCGDAFPVQAGYVGFVVVCGPCALRAHRKLVAGLHIKGRALAQWRRELNEQLARNVGFG